MTREELRTRVAELAREDAQPLRGFMLQAGLDVLVRDGLGLMANSITYAKVFDYLEERYSVSVTRASVHERIWASHDEFRRDVLAEAVEWFPPSVRGDESWLALGTLRDEAPAGSDPVDEVARLVGAALWQEMLSSPTFGRFQAVKAVAIGQKETSADDELRTALARRADERVALGRQRFPEWLSHMGARVRGDLRLPDQDVADLFQILVGTLLVGGHLNFQAGLESLDRPIEFTGTHPDDDRPWTIFSIGVKAILDFLTEVDPHATQTRSSSTVIAQQNTEYGAGQAAEVDGPVGRSADSLDLKRRSRQQLKQLVLSAGVELLFRSNLSLRPEALSYSRIFAYLQQEEGFVVNRASVHKRIWSSHEEYCLEVLALEVGRDLHPLPALLPSAESVARPLEGDSPELRWQETFDTLQSLVESQLDDFAQSLGYKRLLVIKAAVPHLSDGAGGDALRAAIQEIEYRRLTQVNEIVKEHVLRSDFTPRPELAISAEDALQVLSGVTLNMATGVLYDRLCGVETVTRTYELPRIDGSAKLDRHTPASIAIRATFQLLYRLND